MRAVRRIVGALCVMALGTTSALIACTDLIGVEEVRLRRDSGIGSGDLEAGANPSDAAPTTPVANLLEVALGAEHTCARRPDGSVKCWGHDERSQTGTGGTAGGIVASPQTVAMTDARAIAAGQYHTCVVRTSGKISCWGDNQYGQLGDGTTNRSPIPVDVVGVTDAKAVTCGASFSCALRNGGGVECWGAGLGGQLGNGTNVQLQPTPSPVSNLTDAIAIAAGELHACAVKADGKIVCWGNNDNGQLGNTEVGAQTTPATVTSLDGMMLVAAGSRSTCAAKKGGGVFCWGANDVGQLGSGAPNPTDNPAPTVVNILDAVALAAGKDHVCAVKRGGAVACWGSGLEGQIGDDQPRDAGTRATPKPTSVAGITNAIGIGAGGNHSCAPTVAGAILCWGDNMHGQLGLGDAGPAQLSRPASVLNYP